MIFNILDTTYTIFIFLTFISLLLLAFLLLKKLLKKEGKLTVKKGFFITLLLITSTIILGIIVEYTKFKITETHMADDFDATKYCTTITSNSLYVEEGEYEIFRKDNNKKFTGIIVVNDLDNKPWKKAYVYNGKVEKFQFFYNGVLESEYPMKKNNTVEGTVTTFYPNGNIQSKLNYVDNIPEGKYIKYDENNKIIKESIFTNGKEYSKEEAKAIEDKEKEQAKENLKKQTENEKIQKELDKRVSKKLDYDNLILKNDSLYYYQTKDDKGYINHELATGTIDYKKKFEGGQIRIIKGKLIDGKFISYLEKRNYIVLNEERSLFSIPLKKDFYYKKENFKNGKLSGEYFEVTDFDILVPGYNEDIYSSGGITISQKIGNYENGKENGDFKNIEMIFTISDKSKVKDTKIITTWEGRYINGKLNGIVKSYYNNGSIKTIAEYSNGTPVNLYEYYAPNGSVIDFTNYNTGDIKETDSNNKIIKEGNFINGTLKEVKRDGIYTTNFKNGKKEGEFIVYHEYYKDVPIVKGYYRNDNPVGKWEWLDVNGNIIHTKTY